MKIVVSLALLLIVGCQSKPSTRIVQRGFWISECPEGFAIEINVDAGTYSCDGFISHVTQAQWEAAQGLYNNVVYCDGGKRVLLKYPDGSWRPYKYIDAMRMPSITVMCVDMPVTTPGVLDTFPPSGDAK